jgi:hypothetical protein
MTTSYSYTAPKLCDHRGSRRCCTQRSQATPARARDVGGAQRAIVARFPPSSLQPRSVPQGPGGGDPEPRTVAIGRSTNGRTRRSRLASLGVC